MVFCNVHSHDQCNICGELGWLVAAPGNTYSQLCLGEKIAIPHKEEGRDTKLGRLLAKNQYF